MTVIKTNYFPSVRLTGLTLDCSSSSPFDHMSHLTNVWQGVLWLTAKVVNTVLRTFLFSLACHVGGRSSEKSGYKGRGTGIHLYQDQSTGEVNFYFCGKEANSGNATKGRIKMTRWDGILLNKFLNRFNVFVISVKELNESIR